MATTKIKGPKISGIATCVPSRKFDNLTDASKFTEEEVRKVVGMAGVIGRRLADESMCSSDLCAEAADSLLKSLNWKRETIDALIMVTQTPDYLLPSTSTVVHKRLNLSDGCAAFDVGLGCSGYPYGLWLASMMLASNGFRRVLLLHGETPTRFSDNSDRSVSLLFGDAGSATAMEAAETNSSDWFFALHSDGNGYKDMIIESGGFRDRFSKDARKYCVHMNGASIFNFTIKRVPSLIEETLSASGMTKDKIDYFVFHQSNRFIIKHLTKKVSIPDEKAPMILKDFGNTGGPSIPLTITQGDLVRPDDRPLQLMLLGYGVGLSWGSALVTLEPGAILNHTELENT